MISVSLVWLGKVAAVVTMAILLIMFIRRRPEATYDIEHSQHHLASMLISVAAGQDQVSKDDIRAYLRECSDSRPEVLKRLKHALQLAKTAVPPDLHARTESLARDMADTYLGSGAREA